MATAPAIRHVVISLLAGPAEDVVCSWLLAIPADAPSERTLAECAGPLLEQALADGTISPDERSAGFGLRDADPEVDADLYLAEAAAAGRIN